MHATRGRKRRPTLETRAVGVARTQLSHGELVWPCAFIWSITSPQSVLLPSASTSSSVVISESNSTE